MFLYVNNGILVPPNNNEMVEMRDWKVRIVMIGNTLLEIKKMSDKFHRIFISCQKRDPRSDHVTENPAGNTSPCTED